MMLLFDCHYCCHVVRFVYFDAICVVVIVGVVVIALCMCCIYRRAVVVCIHYVVVDVVGIHVVVVFAVFIVDDWCSICGDGFISVGVGVIEFVVLLCCYDCC